MSRIRRGIVVVGGGPAGLAAAISAKKAGADVLLIERDSRLGGILNQCIHDGFGLHEFGEALSGPEYAQKFIDRFEALGIDVMLESMVARMGEDKVLEVNSKDGFMEIEAKAIVLTMGCRERTAGAISLPGTRPAGVYTAGAAQNFINLQNIMVGKRVVILGSGDIGLIMARRMTLEGAKVEAVYEILPYASGLPRNIMQCLNDYDIPLFLSTSVIEIHGKDRVEGVTTAQIGSDLGPIPGTEKYVACDTVLLSVGLIPENERTLEAGIEMYRNTNGALVDDTYMTSVPGVFACGNVLHVHDLVDHVSHESRLAGAFAAQYAMGQLQASDARITIAPKQGVRYVLPQKVSGERDFTLSLRVFEPWRERTIFVKDGERVVAKKKLVRGHPAEMVRINVKAENLKDSTELEVMVVDEKESVKEVVHERPALAEGGRFE